MKITVKALTGPSFNIICDSASTMLDIREEICKHWNVHPKDQRLVVNGKNLLDDKAKVNSLHLSAVDPVIHLVLRLPSFQFQFHVD